MKNRLSHVTAALGMILVAPLASAWGPTGHRATGRIAERHLTPEAARAVRELLAPETLTYVTTWADEIRGEILGPAEAVEAIIGFEAKPLL